MFKAILMLLLIQLKLVGNDKSMKNIKSNSVNHKYLKSHPPKFLLYMETIT